jgi:hypothetical protein
VAGCAAIRCIPGGTPKILKISLLLSEQAEYGRGVPSGIADFAKGHPHWRFRVETPDHAGLKATTRANYAKHRG